MSPFTNTPQPPYYIVAFTTQRKEGDHGYEAMAEKMLQLAAQQDGYLGVESVRAHEDKTYVNIVVHDRKQIAEVIRNLRMHFGFPRVTRLAQPLNAAETPIAS